MSTSDGAGTRRVQRIFTRCDPSPRPSRPQPAQTAATQPGSVLAHRRQRARPVTRPAGTRRPATALHRIGATPSMPHSPERQRNSPIHVVFLALVPRRSLFIAATATTRHHDESRSQPPGAVTETAGVVTDSLESEKPSSSLATQPLVDRLRELLLQTHALASSGGLGPTEQVVEELANSLHVPICPYSRLLRNTATRVDGQRYPTSWGPESGLRCGGPGLGLPAHHGKVTRLKRLLIAVGIVLPLASGWSLGHVGPLS